VFDNLDASSSIFHYEEDGTMHAMQFLTLRPKSTIYYTSTSLPDCGARCDNVYAFESNGIAAFYYKCQINISNMANETLQE